MLSLFTLLLNPGILEWQAEELRAKCMALEELFERALGAKPGSLSFLRSLEGMRGP
jgi:hypothetical protein